MVINIALWADTGLFGDWGTDGRLYWNPLINTFIKPFGQEIAGPAGLADLRDDRRR